MLRAITVIYFLFFCLHVFGQQNKPPASSGNVSKLLPEKILVHNDKDFYICGEIMWYKVYVVNELSNQLQSLSKTAYAELSDPNGNTVYHAKVELKKGTGYGSFQIPLNANSGNYELRVYTNWMKNNPSSIFSKNIAIVNTSETFDVSAFKIESDSLGNQTELNNNSAGKVSESSNSPVSFKINITADKNTYQQRSLASFDIAASEGGAKITSNLSVAVYKLNELNKPGGLFYDNLGSDNSFGKTSGLFKNDPYTYLPEMNGYIVTVKVLNAATGNAQENVPVILSVTGKLVNVQYAQSDKNGFAYFNLKNVYGSHLLLIKTTPQYENTVDINLVQPFLNNAGTSEEQKIILKDSYLNAVEEMHNNMVINKEFRAASMNEFYSENTDSVAFYGKPYKSYLLDNYKRFVTMEEVLREYVQEVSVRIKSNDYYLPVFNRQYFDLGRYMEVSNMMTDQPPLALIDGVPVTSMNKVIKYDPLKVRKIDVVADKYFIGKESFDGIISFTTYKGQFEDLELNKKDVLVDDEGWQYHRIFFEPEYKTLSIKNNRIPDFRELLYWDPEVETSASDDGKISFYTGDLTGKFVVVVKGVSEDGKVGSKTFQFEVVK